MRASECRIGKKLRHKELKTIIEVKEIDGSKVWEDTQWGDIFDWVDEDLYDDLDYVNEQLEIIVN